MSNHGFEHLESIYRNYDIRGKYPEQITAEEVEAIGAAMVTLFKCNKVAVGRDIRPSSPILQAALTKGLINASCDVVDLGEVTTPMTYYVCGSTDVDATVMITASHMPSEYNGLKIAIEDAKPVDAATLKQLALIVGENVFTSTEKIGVETSDSPLVKWRQQFKAAHSFQDKKLKVVIDPANMIGGIEIETFKQFEPWIEVYTLYDDFDHTTPNHEANPIKPETLIDLGKAVVEFGADIGIAFDGDADRVGFVDETGAFVPADLAGALIAKRVLEKNPGGTIVYDLRSSQAVPQTIAQVGGKSIEWKVGHTHIRTKMRELGALMGIELAGHYFFKDTFYSEGGPLPAFLLLELLHESQYSLSTLISNINPYHHSGEINSTVSRPIESIYADLRTAFPDATVSELDGLKFVTKDWWFNVRPSANDPVLRLNLEASTAEIKKEQLEKVLSVIRAQ